MTRKRTTHPPVAKELRPIVAYLRDKDKCSFEVRAGKIVVIGANGRPVQGAGGPVVISSKGKANDVQAIKQAEGELRRAGLLSSYGATQKPVATATAPRHRAATQRPAPPPASRTAPPPTKAEEAGMAATNGYRQDTRVEALLDSYGVTEYDLRRVQLAQVDIEAGIRNQARYQALDEEWVILVAEAMERTPREVGPVLLWKQPRHSKLIPLDGNHRLAGAGLLELRAWDAYVVNQDLSRLQVLSITFAANRGHGKPTSLRERLDQALLLVAEGASHADAAAVLALPVDRVSKRVALDRLRGRLQRLGMGQVAERLTQHTMQRLDSVVSDEVLKAATDVIASTRMTGRESSDFIAKLNRHRHSEAEQLALIEQEREARRPEVQQTAGGTFKLPTSVRRLQAALSSIGNLDVGELAEARIDDTMRQRLKARAADGIQKLVLVQEAL